MWSVTTGRGPVFHWVITWNYHLRMSLVWIYFHKPMYSSLSCSFSNNSHLEQRCWNCLKLIPLERWRWRTSEVNSFVVWKGSRAFGSLHCWVAVPCEFMWLRECHSSAMIQDRIICGMLNDCLWQRSLQESGLTLEKCVSICQKVEKRGVQAMDRTIPVEWEHQVKCEQDSQEHYKQFPKNKVHFHPADSCSIWCFDDVSPPSSGKHGDTDSTKLK